MRTDYVQVMKLMGNVHCLVIALHLMRGRRSLDALMRETGYSDTNIGYHIKRLRGKGLVEGERAGSQMHYRLADRHGDVGAFIARVVRTFGGQRRRHAA